MKIIALLIALVFFSITAWSAPANGTHVVALFGNEQPEIVSRDYGVGRIKTWHRFQAGRWGALSGFTCSPNANQLERLQRDTRVQFIDANVTVSTLGSVAYTEIGLPGMDLASGYAARNAKYLDPATGLVPVLLVKDYLYPTAKFYISFVNYTAKTYSLAEVPVLGDPSYAQPGGGCCLMGTNVWLTMLENKYWNIKHFGTIGSPVTNLVLIENIPYPLVSNSTTNSYCWYEQVHETLFPTTAGGILGGFRTPPPFAAPAPVYMNALYRSPLGLTWNTQVIGGYGGTEEIRTTYAQHPGDGSIWSFSVTPVGSACNITSTRGFELNNLYTNVTINPDFISYLYTTNVPWCAYGEIAPIGVITDTAHRKLVLTYPNWEYIPIVLPPPTQHPTIVVLDANGTWRPSRETNTFLHFFDAGVLAMVEGDHYQVLYKTLAGAGSMAPGPLHTRTYTNLVGGDSGVGWGSETLMIPMAEPFPSYIQNVPGFLVTSSTDLVTRLYYPVTNTVSSQVIPSGIRRIGCQSNTVWKVSNTTPVNCDVAVIDTGIDLTHPDLNVYTNVTFVTGTTSGNDDNGHGTHCAGIVGAKNNSFGVVGVAPGCRLWAVKAFDSTGNGDLSSIISAVDYVTAHADQIEIASCSWGHQGQADTLRLAIQNSVARGVVYVAAAGNSGFEVYGGDKVFGTSDDFWPASYPEVMCVAAMGDSDGLPGGIGVNPVNCVDDSYADFSNYATVVDSSKPVSSPGLAVDVMAPGVAIYSTYKNGGFATLKGTSMACPHAAGAVALYIATHGRATDATGVYAINQAIVDRATDATHMGLWPWNLFNALFSFAPPPLIDVSDGPKPTNYPVVTMTSPRPSGGNSYANNETITCTATASDATDGNLTANIVWRAGQAVGLSESVWSKVLGTGGTISVVVTNLGANRVAASVVNSAGRYSQADAVIYIQTPTGRTAPTVAITSPVDGSTAASTATITFSGTATDTVDGNIAANLQWNSSIDGYLGTGASFTGNLSAGSHAITASVTNSAGLWGSHLHSVTITAPASPTVAISAPTTGASFAEGDPVTFTGTATDPVDGNIAARLLWTSSIDGVIGTGATFITTSLHAGTHSIVATATNSFRLSGSATITISVTSAPPPTTPPTVTVTSPFNGSTYTTTNTIRFTATATDAIDGNIAANVGWQSSLSGYLGTGATILRSLVLGTHKITASVTNSSSLTGSDSVTVYVVNPANHPPTISITSPPDRAAYPKGSTVPIYGSASDFEQGDLSSTINWTGPSGLFAIGSNASTNGLPLGTNTITASVRDSQGAVAIQSRSVIITATNAPAVVLSVSVTTDRTSYVNKMKAQVRATVTTNSVPVSGASVTFTIRGASGKTQTKPVVLTGATGVAPCVQNIQSGQLGIGTATITATATKAGAVSGVGSTTISITR